MENDIVEYVIVDDQGGAESSASSAHLRDEEATRKEIVAWLNPSDYQASSSEYTKHRVAHTPGTGVWIERSQEYIQWHQQNTFGSLWIKGVPGSGKSVIAAEIVSRLLNEDNEEPLVLFFFFRHIISTNRTPLSLLRDWLAQTLPRSRMLQSMLKTYIDNDRSLDSLSFDELWGTLLASLKYMRKVYCVADALDEMDPANEAFLERIVSLGKLSPTSIKVLVTSRPVPSLEMLLKNSSILQIHLEQHRMRQDIDTYVNHRFNDEVLSHLGSGMASQQFRQLLTEILGQNGQGLFLYAKLMSDKVAASLARGVSCSEPSMILQSLPGNLEAMYNRLLKEHSERLDISLPMQLAVLKWATHAARALRLIELAGAISAGLSDENIDFKSMKETVRLSCGPLLEIFEDETVQVIHHSFTEFLLDRTRQHRTIPEDLAQFPIVTPENSHRELAISCLRVLVADGAKFDPSSRERKPQFRPKRAQTSKSQPFLSYAKQYWAYHASRYDFHDEDIFKLLDQYMLPNVDEDARKEEPESHGSAEKRFSRFGSVDGAKIDRTFMPLENAASAGLSKYVERLLAQGYAIDGDGRDMPPISTAAMGGHLEVVRTLATHGASLDLDDSKGLKPIHYAAIYNHAPVVKFLLENGVEANSTKTREAPGIRCGNAPRTVGYTALKFASESGHVETILELIPYSEMEDLETSLRCAATHGKSKVVLALLERSDVSANPKSFGEPPLYLAAFALDLTSIRALIDHGTDVSKKASVPWAIVQSSGRREPSCNGGNAIHAAAEAAAQLKRDDRLASNNDFAEILDLLVSAGLDINEVDAAGQTPLFQACQSRGFDDDCNITEKITKELLVRGADASIVNLQGNNVFGQPLPTFTKENLKLLIKNGAQLNFAQKSDGKTLLYRSVEQGRYENMESMLALGADPLVRDQSGNNLLHAVFQDSLNRRWKNSLATLFSTGTVNHLINIPNNAGETCLHSFVSKKPNTQLVEQIFDFLVKVGGDLEARNNAGETVLLRFIGSLKWPFSPEVVKDVKTFLKFEPKIDARDYEGKSVLHIAARLTRMTGCTEVLELLVEKGADPRWVDNEGNTLLHEVIMKRPQEHGDLTLGLLQFLTKLGLSTTAGNHKGQIPLHVAVSAQVENGQKSSSQRRAVVGFLADQGQEPNINYKDRHGRTPLHFAAAMSQGDVWQLLDLGADPLVQDADRQSPLQVACRGRQINIVGMLLEAMSRSQDADLVNRQDVYGRTALHDACRSGISESVRLLLDAGSDVCIRDTKRQTPLHSCQDYITEIAYWDALVSGSQPDRIFASESFRCVIENDRNPKRDCSVRISDVVRMLLDTGKLVEAARMLLNFHSPFRAEKSSMWREIQRWLMQNEGIEVSSKFRKIFLDLQYSWTAVTSDFIRQDKLGAMEIFEHIVGRDDDDLVEKLVQDGFDLTYIDPSGNSALHKLAAWGYASLLKKIGAQAILFDDYDQKVETLDKHTRQEISIPILQVACERHVYNMEVIKTLVDDLNVSLDAQRQVRPNDPESSHELVPGKTALHCLAGGTEWWHEQAITFLLQRGANPNIKDHNGDTPLHVALTTIPDHNSFTSPSGEGRARALLKGKADPNIRNEKGISCLNRAGVDAKIFRMLLKAGADVSHSGATISPIFSAVHSQNAEILQILLEHGVSCNVRLGRSPQLKRMTVRKRSIHGCVEYPLLHAALGHSETDGYAMSRNTSNPDKWPEIVEILLNHGADPALSLNDGNQTILHIVCERNGIIEPFLNSRSVDWEIRDSKGCTPLLTACDSVRSNAFLGCEEGKLVKQLASHGVDRTVIDGQGRNMLHHLILSENNPYEGRDMLQPFIIIKVDDIVLELLASYADVRSLCTKKDNTGLAPIHCSLVKRRITLSRALMKEGSDVLDPDPDGNNVLHHLASGLLGSDSEAVKALFDECLAKGADLNHKNKAGQPPLFKFLSACATDDKPNHRSKFGVFANADLFARDKTGKTALHIVADRQCRYSYTGVDPQANTMDIFKFLMDFGLDPLAEDNACMTALDVAAAARNQKIMDLFARVTK